MGENFDTRGAALFLGMSPATLAVWRITNRGPSYLKLGRRVLYRRESLERFQASHTIDPERDSQPAA